MATIYRCDICGSETKDTDEIFKINIPNLLVSNSSSHFDICKTCMRHLHKFLEGASTRKD